MGYFLRFWYLNSFSWTWNHYLSTIAAFEGQIAVQATFHNINKPLFQDYTFQGRIIGFFFRLFRIISGLLIYLFLGIFMALFYLLWVLLPVLCIVSILGFFFASPLSSIPGVEEAHFLL
jgi:hypothetical protein